MPHISDPQRFDRAAGRFHQFFGELRQVFIEREEVITQFELALLSREHVLMTGPPGTAKSQMASSVLGRIIDEGTGQPSVFARQFTENTVQTDIIGPIDFKTLMESGRTTHFTDEGMLGAIHAFLDEVFDGRDMLLRSTLNLLHERELKQGDLVTRGKIECAFMTSNRYIAEVLESARETLLAFIDRIAFISFVPRGFADPENFKLVIQRHGGGLGRQQLEALLTVQDLDVLQHAVDRTYVSKEICDGLANLILALDSELASTMRADPNFQPTRYLSTRTAVKAAGILRSAVVLDMIHGRRDRPRQVDWDDLGSLRHFLMLSGLSSSRISALMQHETDPRERRQLEIMRTEAEIFARCLAKVPRSKLTPEPPAPRLDTFLTMAVAARRSRDPQQLVRTAQALVKASESGDFGADQVGPLLLRTLGALSEQALRAGLQAPATASNQDVLELVRGLSVIADDLERVTSTHRSLAQWLRGRLIDFLDESLHLAPVMTETSLGALLASDGQTQDLVEQAKIRLEAVAAVKDLRHRLETGGAWVQERERSQQVWSDALAKLEGELVLLWDRQVRGQVTEILSNARGKRLNEVFASLSGIAKELKGFTQQVGKLGVESQLDRRVLGPHLEPFVASVFERMQIVDRQELITQVEEVAAELERSALDGLIDVDKFVLWATPALTRGERERKIEPHDVRSQEEYHQARNQEDALGLAETLVEISLRLLPPQALRPKLPRDYVETIKVVLQSLPTELQRQVAELDLARLERRVHDLEGWWSGLDELRQATESGPEAAITMLEQVVTSGFLRVMRGDAELLRLAMAAKNLGELFPDHAERATALRRRLEQLDSDSGAVLVSLLEGHSQRAWKATLGHQET